MGFLVAEPGVFWGHHVWKPLAGVIKGNPAAAEFSKEGALYKMDTVQNEKLQQEINKFINKWATK